MKLPVSGLGLFGVGLAASLILLAGLTLNAPAGDVQLGAAQAQSLRSPGTRPAFNRTGFQIGTGPASERFFPVGELMAGLISHPPGAQRCERAPLCGPLGLIATVRTSDGAITNLQAIDRGQFNSGLAPSNLVADAQAGKGAFAKSGALQNLRVMAALFPETIHLLVANDAKIKSPADLRRKRVLLGPHQSANHTAARSVLATYRLNERQITPHYESLEHAAELLRSKKVDAVFIVGAVPSPLVQQILAAKTAHLVALDGAGRSRLLAAQKALAPDQLHPAIYGLKAPLETVKSRALWVVHKDQPASLIYDLTRALFEPGNQNLVQSNLSLRHLTIDTAARGLPAPLHRGAERFYRDKNKLN